MTSHYNNPNYIFAAQNGMAKEMHSEKMGTRMAYNQADISSTTINSWRSSYRI